MRLKGEMEVEVLKDTTDRDNAARARRRAERIVMSAGEAELYCEAPNQARGNDRPAYPDPMYGDTTEG
jgi:hypothetical protein